MILLKGRDHNSLNLFILAQACRGKPFYLSLEICWLNQHRDVVTSQWLKRQLRAVAINRMGLIFSSNTLMLSYNFWKSYNTITLLTAKFPYRNISHYVITEIVIYLQVLPYAFDLYVQSWEWVTITTVRCYQHGKIKIYTYTCMYIYIFQKNILKASRRASIDNILSSESTRLQKLFF